MTFRPTRHFSPAYIVLITGLLMTVIAAAYIYFASYERERVRFGARINDFNNKLSSTMQTYVSLLRAGAGLFEVEENQVSKEEFKSFVDKFNLRERYPGVQGIGFSQKKEEIHEIVFLEPRDSRNEVAIGYNMFSQPVRREAMTRAAETGTSAISGKVVLLQEIDDNKQAGFMIFFPVYDVADITNLSAEERMEHLVGYMYSPFRAGDFMRNTFNPGVDQIAVTVYDTEAQPQNLMYDSLNGSNHKSRFVANTQIEIFGRIWTIQFRSLPSFEAYSGIELVPVVLFLGTIINVTLYLLVKTGLALREERVEILERVADGFISVNYEGVIVYINKEAAEIFEVSPKKALGRNFLDILPVRAHKKITTIFEKAVKEKVPYRFEWYYKAIDSWFGIRVYPGNSGTSIFILDITRRKKLEHQKDEFLGLASHELKTPLTSLKAYAQVLHRQFLHKSDLESATHLTKMIDQINRLTRLITELLDVTRIQAGKLQFNTTKFDFDNLIAETVEEVQRTSSTHKIVITKNTSIKIKADRERLGQVLVNLLSNAIKYSPKAHQVNVSSIKYKDILKVSVQDFGIGIPKERQRQIFKRFYRVDSEADFAGLGLGLYIASQIVRRHGGKIWVKSKDKKGSTFIFTLPLKSVK